MLAMYRDIEILAVSQCSLHLQVSTPAHEVDNANELNARRRTGVAARRTIYLSVHQLGWLAKHACREMSGVFD